MSFRVLFCAVVLTFAQVLTQTGGSAHAATSAFSVFPDRVFSTPATVAGAGNLQGNTPATATFSPSGIALFDFATSITNNSFTIDITDVFAPTQLSVRFVDLTGFTVTDTSPGSFPGPSPLDLVLNITAPGAFVIPGESFSAACSAIGGCNSVLLNVTGAGGFVASTVSSAPEPTVWALMILGFIGVAWRMKSMRGDMEASTAYAIDAIPAETLLRPVYNQI